MELFFVRRTWSHSAVEFMKYRRRLPQLMDKSELEGQEAVVEDDQDNEDQPATSGLGRAAAGGSFKVFCPPMPKQLNLHCSCGLCPQTRGAASQQELSWRFRPQTPAGDPLQTPFRRGLGAEPPASFLQRSCAGSGGGAPSKRKLSCFGIGDQHRFTIILPDLPEIYIGLFSDFAGS